MIDPKDLPKYVGEEYILQFIREITPVREDVSSPVLEHCRVDGVPILSDETRTLVGFLLSVICPKRILEVGTAYGASALYMSQFLQEEGHLDTIERNPAMLVEAIPHLKESGLLDKKIFLHQGHAQEIIPTFKEPYDFILIDASMGQYSIFWEEIQSLVHEGTVILSDNVLHGGMVAMERLDIPRRQRTIHTRLRDFLETVLKNDQYQSSLLPLGDGVLLSVKK